MGTDDIQVAREKLKQKLQNSFDAKKLDIVCSYHEVSVAFPGDGTVQRSFDTKIDFKALELWAMDLGWYVKPADEATPDNMKHIPHIRFTHISHK